jgi:WD40 repeat protein
LRCLEKSPRRRYTTAIELAEDLQRFQAGEPIRARPVGPVERAYRWCRRRPLVAGLMALSSVLAVAFVVTVLILYARLRDTAAQLRDTATQLRKKTEEQHLQIIHLNIEIGILDLEDDDLLAALLRFAEALRQEDENHLDEQSDRTRIATILRQSPRLDRLVALDRQVICARLGERGDSSGWVATVDGDNVVEIWEAPTGRRIGSPLRQEEAPVGGEFSADGQMLALIGASGAVQVCNLRTGKSNRLPATEGGPVKRVYFHTDCPVLTAQHADSAIRFWDCGAEEPVLMKELSGKDTALAAMSDDGRWCIRVTGDQEVEEWEVRTAEPTGPPWKLAHGVRSGAISADGRRLAVVGPDESVEVLDSAAGKLLSASIKPRDGVREVLLSPDGETVLTVTAQGFAREWTVQTGRLVAEWPKMKCAPGGTHFSQSGRFVVMHDGAGVTEVVNTVTGRVIVPPLRHADNLALAAHSADGKQLITIGKHGLICTWTLPVVPRPEPAKSLEEEFRALREAKGSMKRVPLKSGLNVQVEKWMTDAAVRPPTAEGRDVDQAAFSPDGHLVAIAVEERTVVVFDVLTGEPVARPLRHRDAVHYAAFSPDGRRLVTATAGGTARVWGVPTGEALAPPLQHGQAIQRVAFSADGNRVLALHEGKTATAWDVTPDQRSVQVLMQLAQVNACGRIDDKEDFEKINADRMRELFERVHAPD